VTKYAKRMSPFKLSRLGTLDIDTLTRQMNLIAGAEDDPIRRLQILANVRWLLDDDIRTAVANALERSLEGMIRAERGLARWWGGQQDREHGDWRS
jgi:hypothetical protein